MNMDTLRRLYRALGALLVNEDWIMGVPELMSSCAEGTRKQ
jgi:hypothetical protein